MRLHRWLVGEGETLEEFPPGQSWKFSIIGCEFKYVRIIHKIQKDNGINSMGPKVKRGI